MTRSYEVRVEGELGEPLLRYLSWSYGVIPEQTFLLVDATPAELDALLRDCTDEGLIIERVRRISSIRPCPPGAHDSSGRTQPLASRARAHDPGEPHRRDG